MKFKMYGMRSCIDCINAKKLLKEKNIDYELIEITKDTASMKEFFKLRDNLNEFAKIRQRSTIGVPFFVFEDGKMTFDVDEAIEYSKK